VAGIRPSHHHINAGGRSCPSLTPSAGWPSWLHTRRLLQSSTHPAWSEVSLTFYVRIHHYFHCHYWSVSSFFNFFTETKSSFCSFYVSFAPPGLSTAGPIRTGRGRGAALQDLIRAGGADRDADGPEARCAVAGPEAPLSLSFLSVCYYHKEEAAVAGPRVAGHHVPVTCLLLQWHDLRQLPRGNILGSFSSCRLLYFLFLQFLHVSTRTSVMRSVPFLLVSFSCKQVFSWNLLCP